MEQILNGHFGRIGTDFPVNAHTRVCARAHDARTRMYEAYTKKASEVSEVSETEVRPPLSGSLNGAAGQGPQAPGEGLMLVGRGRQAVRGESSPPTMWNGSQCHAVR
jgi:hypothetical protein